MRDDYRTMTGPEKAALLVMALGEAQTAQLFALMEDDEIRELSQIMATLGTVSAQLIERLLVEFADQISTTGTIVGSYDSTERLLMKVLDKDRVDTIMEEIRGPAGRTMWEKLANVNENVLANYLKNEYPQTVAVILSKVKPEHASRVLGLLPEPFAMEVVMRMLRMEAVQKDVLDDVERTLRNEFMSNLARTNRRDSHEMMADIFNFLDRNVESRFMNALEERNKDSAERIKALMFTFEDLGNLDPGGVQTLLSAAEKDKLAIALKGSSESLRDLFFTNMSERAAKIMKEDMQAMGPIRLKDVDEAQMYMVTIAKDLAEKGEIVMADSKGEDELVY
ncbi:flagellar motor switch protein FliG [Kiloniella litopenaei]|uniref:Flagellar motor switch protein FliG n=1 Tax=Kiloniella litopenaei TaxID=1549748 RepID=A0A0M2R7J0_9PROT|nr:flagellar motor switch protein FliG [Kiloniella litopenaei]KKJ76369.1 flagellar motor switch protein FliG [Kiloniella litopenaei]